MTILNFNTITQTPLAQLKKHKLYQLPISVVKFANAFGIDVVTQTYPLKTAKNQHEELEYIRGYILIDKKQDIKEISLDNFQSYEHKRYTAAYLLCGYLMEKVIPFQENMEGLIFVENQLDHEIVYQTDNLMVPEKLLKKEISQKDIIDYDRLEKMFQVPDQLLRQKVLKYRS